MYGIMHEFLKTKSPKCVQNEACGSCANWDCHVQMSPSRSGDFSSPNPKSILSDLNE